MTQKKPEMATTCTRRELMVYAGLAGIAAATPASSAQAEPTRSAAVTAIRPNIILLVTDDQRWDTLGCSGNSVIRTPHLDRLASEGILFLNSFCTTSICMVSRASILTGLHKRCHTVESFRQPLPEPLFAKSYPALMRAAGYRTGFVGKWGLGGALPAAEFDYFDGFPGQGSYFHEIDGNRVHLTKLLTEKAIGFLKGCSPEQPFCLSVSFKAPHVQDADPRQFLYDPAFENLYQDVPIATPKTGGERHYKALPEFLQHTEGRRRWQRRFATPAQFQESVKGYYRLIAGVDAAVGQIRDAIAKLGSSKNTIILFTSDNGFFLGEHGLAGKWLMHEESVRTPLIIHDPRLPTSVRGRHRKEMALNIDLAPTVLDLAGIDIPHSIQGRSLVPLMTDQTTAWRTEWFYEHDFGEEAAFPATEGVRTDRWKYIRYARQNPPFEQLYDLANDPHEERNLAGDEGHKNRLETLRSRWAVWREHLERWQPDAAERWRDLQ